MSARLTENSGAWERLPNERLAPAGLRGPDAMTWISRAAVAALALAAVWWAWVAVRPLPRGPEADIAEVPAIPRLTETASSEQQREQLVAQLGAENLFAADRAPWSRTAEAPVADAASDPEKSGQVATDAPTASAAPATGSSARGAIAFTPRERLPDDVKKALTAIELKALRTDESGEGVAMISFVHSPERPRSTPFRVGDEFKEDTNPQAAWRVEAIEVERRRVILSRGGVFAALPLYKGLGDGPAPVAAAREQPAEAPGTGVETRTRDEVIVELRRKGLSEADIEAVIAELDRQLAESGEAPIRALGTVLQQPGEADVGEGQRTPPSGMEAVLQMMAAQSQQAKPEAEKEGRLTGPRQRERERRRRP